MTSNAKTPVDYRERASEYYCKLIDALDRNRYDNEGYEFFIRRAIIRLDDPAKAKAELEHLLEHFVYRERKPYVRTEDLDLTEGWNLQLYGKWEGLAAHKPLDTQAI